tara:strand:+ start:221 stop:418 length:198 start_codon:yes stop_codon:yes gene_type:complete
MQSKKTELREKPHPDYEDHMANCLLPSEKVYNLLIKELSHDSTWQQSQLDSFKKLANGFLLKGYQ